MILLYPIMSARNCGCAQDASLLHICPFEGNITSYKKFCLWKVGTIKNHHEFVGKIFGYTLVVFCVHYRNIKVIKNCIMIILHDNLATKKILYKPIGNHTQILSLKCLLGNLLRLLSCLVLLREIEHLSKAEKVLVGIQHSHFAESG